MKFFERIANCCTRLHSATFDCVRLPTRTNSQNDRRVTRRVVATSYYRLNLTTTNYDQLRKFGCFVDVCMLPLTGMQKYKDDNVVEF